MVGIQRLRQQNETDLRLERTEPQSPRKTRAAHLRNHHSRQTIEASCRDEAKDRPIEFRQTNSEAQLIDWIHEAIDSAAGIIINPAAFTFTSIAVLDALKMFAGPIIELHITNIHKREAYYHHSYVSKVATAVIAGLGPSGYRTATRAMIGELLETADGPNLQEVHRWL
jgi:3-dehydroquinate dehydratase II